MAMAKTKKKNKKLLAVAAAVLALITLLAGTFAWITSKDDVLNELSTDQITNNAVIIQEVFTPPPSWDPGMSIDKQVTMVNTGDATALVRVSFEEILYLLKNNGVATTSNTTTPAEYTSDWIEVKVNIDAYVASGSGWTVVDDIEDNGHDADDVTIMYNKQTSTSGETSYGYFAYRTIDAANGIYQKVDLGTFEPTYDASGDIASIDLTGDLTYYWYEGRDLFEDRTASTTEYVGSSADILSPDFALSLYSYDKVNGGIDTSAGAIACTIDAPVDAAQMTAQGNDNASAGTSMIKITFANDGTRCNVTTDIDDAVEYGLWYYNQADGYFYYMAKVGAGGSTKMLIESLTMDGGADIEHSLMDYKLGVVSGAIQNTAAAITSSTGWGIANSGSGLGYELCRLCDN